MAEKTVRLYTVSDLHMIQKAKELFVQFNHDQESFRSLFPKQFPLNYYDSLVELIDSWHDAPSDSLAEITQMQATEELNASRTLFMKKYRVIRVFIEEAFADSPEKKAQMGIGTISKKSRSRDQFIQFVRLFCELIRENEQSLLAEGCSESMFSTFEEIRDSLVAAREKQGLGKIKRQDGKVVRITALNAIWKTMAYLCRTARVVFQNDPTRAARYTLPAGKRRKRSVSAVPETVEYTAIAE